MKADDVLDKVVVGNLPMQLATFCRFVIAVEFSGQPPRGAEYSLEDMEKAGAQLSCYKVERVDHYLCREKE